MKAGIILERNYETTVTKLLQLEQIRSTRPWMYDMGAL